MLANIETRIIHRHASRSEGVLLATDIDDVDVAVKKLRRDDNYSCAGGARVKYTSKLGNRSLNAVIASKLTTGAIKRAQGQNKI